MPNLFMRGLPRKARRLLSVIMDQHPVEEDGGPGSGNWGHKGRPGMVGGSGKGGGKQYRGGRSDIAYVSSRRDWLNGLKGERQHEAQTFMKKMREYYNKPEEEKKPVEQLIMEEPGYFNGANSNREKLLEYMAEARSWQYTARKLIDENLDENDKKLAAALADKYGKAFTGGAELPDESDTPSWDADDLRTWQDIKSKAMGGPTSGKEAPDELLYAAGLKEKPKKTGYEWTEGLSKYTKEHIIPISLAEASGMEMPDTPEKMDKCWQEMISAAALTDMGSTPRSAAMNLLFYKGLQTGWNKALKQGNIPNLSADEQEELKTLFSNAGGGNAYFNQNTGRVENAKMLEGNLAGQEDFFRQFEQDPKKQQRYILLKNKALGGPDPESEADYIARKKEEIKAAKQARENEIETVRNNMNAGKRLLYAANTSQEVAGILSKSGIFREGATCSLEKTDVNMARLAARSYYAVADRYPFLIGRIGGLDEKAIGSHTYASCSMSLYGEVHLNASEKFFGDTVKLEMSYQNDVRAGWHPQDTGARSIVTHELGHTLDGYLTQRKVLGSTYPGTEAQSFSGILRRRVLRALKTTKANIGKEVSRYAEKSSYEWFAECFAEAMHSPTPRPMASEMMRQLDEIIRQEGLMDA